MSQIEKQAPVVITGANRGVGLSLVNEYLDRGCKVIGICREASSALKASGAEVISGIELTDPTCIASLQECLSQVSLLINNAGILRSDTLGDIDYAAIEQQISINALAPLRLSEALINNIVEGGKIAMITSRMGSIEDNSSGSYYGYRISKAALNAAGKSLAMDLKPRGIAVAMLHPGFVQTQMVNHAGDISPGEAANRLASRIDSLTLENTGTFWHSNGDVLSW